MATNDIQGFQFMGEPHEGDSTVLQLNYEDATFEIVAMSNNLLPALIESLLAASDVAEAAEVGVALGVMRPAKVERVARKVVGEPIDVAAWIVVRVAAHADDERCVVLDFAHGRHVTRARMIPEAARLMAAHAASRADLN